MDERFELDEDRRQRHRALALRVLYYVALLSVISIICLYWPYYKANEAREAFLAEEFRSLAPGRSVQEQVDTTLARADRIFSEQLQTAGTVAAIGVAFMLGLVGTLYSQAGPFDMLVFLMPVAAAYILEAVNTQAFLMAIGAAFIAVTLKNRRVGWADEDA